MPAGLQLRVRGVVTSAECRTTPRGHPLVTLEMTDAATGLTVRAHHAYPDASGATHHVAHALVRRLRGQQAEFDATNPRLRGRRIDCDAAHIQLSSTPESTRKDLQ